MKNNILETIGNTPTVQLKSTEFKCNLYAKLEFFNPFGSVKDRAALQIINDAEKSQKLKKRMRIVEATSGNMGISLCAIGVIKEYKTTIIMPENMSEMRKNLIKSYGGELILTDADKGMKGAIEVLNKFDENIFKAHQFENMSSVMAHILHTAPEIDKQMNKKVDAIICGIGTGGTITGIANYFYQRNVKIIGVEPKESPFLSKGYSSAHGIQGIGAGFCPKILNINLIDEIMCVSYNEAISSSKQILNRDGLFVGISSGAVYAAAKKIANREEFADKNIVLIFADGGERYL